MSATGKIMKIAILVLYAGLSAGCFGTSGKNNTAGTGSDRPDGDRQFPVRYSYEVVAVFPHEVTSYTQGLYWHDGYLWEGTGQYRQSALLQVDLETGEAVRRVDLDPGYFGEGIALLDGKIYQLTWLEGTGLVYDAETLRQVDTFEYSGQGWGLTTDGRMLYMSNGSHEIAVIDPANFNRKRTMRVSLDKRRLSQINELEWIDGRIWANIYGADQIAIINPANGIVEGIVDLTGILPDEDRTIRTDVLNGIAYDADAGRIFVTGKNWPKLFEIRLVER